MNKIYCKNCKFYNDFLLFEEDEDCSHPICFEEKNTFIIDSPIQKEKITTRKRKYNMVINVMNKNNDCVYYQRKWWKFWIK